MLSRSLGALLLLFAAWLPGAAAQSSPGGEGDPVTDGRPLSEWIADLQAPAPQTRNAAAYEIAGLGPAGAPAVPALVKLLDDEMAAVRFPATVALGEIGPAAAEAIPRLLKVYEEDINDEVAAGARRAIKRIRPEAVPRQ